MVFEILANGGEVDLHRDVVRLEVRCWPDATRKESTASETAVLERSSANFLPMHKDNWRVDSASTETKFIVHIQLHDWQSRYEMDR